MMVQKVIQTNGRRKRGPATPQGRQNLIASRLAHGVRSRNPVLLQLENEAEWNAHLEGYRLTYNPQGLVEENLVLMVAYQDWKLLHRLIPYENDKTYETLIHPEEFCTNGVCSEDVQQLLDNGEEALRDAIGEEQTRLERYRVLLNGADGQVFSKAETQEILTWIAEQIQEHLHSDEDDEEALADAEEEIDVEDRDWTASEIQQQLAILGEVAKVSWQKELAQLLSIWEEHLDRRREAIDKALSHLRLHRILSPEQHERFALYERQILGTRKALVNSLERLQAMRTGQPVLAPVSVDVALTSAHEADVQSAIP
jgi:hypothetical protein